MAKIETYQCDVCGATKGEANHWWSLLVDEKAGVFAMQPFVPSATGGGPTITISAVNCAVLQALHCCGQDCVLKKLSEVMHSERHEI